MGGGVGADVTITATTANISDGGFLYSLDRQRQGERLARESP